MTARSIPERRMSGIRLSGAIIILVAACSSPPAMATDPLAQPPSAEPVPTSTGSEPTSQYALVVVADAIDVRTGPGAHHPIAEAGFFDAGQAGSMPMRLAGGELIWVLDDPVTIGGQQWFHVATTDRPNAGDRFLTGWIAGGDGGNGSVERFDGPCPDPEGILVEDALNLGRFGRLACFGSTQFSVTGEIQLAEIACQRHWLMCATGFLETDTGESLSLYLDPAGDIELPPPGAHALVLGRLEHPSSSGCGIGTGSVEAATAAVLFCRSRFTVESVTSPPPIELGEPVPVLEVVGTESIDSGRWNRYTLQVANAGDYPAELFAAAPDLPPCGASPHSARAWVDIFDEFGAPITTFCALADPEGLRELPFTRMAGVPPPTVYIEIKDRVTGVVYRSNTVRFDDN